MEHTDSSTPAVTPTPAETQTLAFDFRGTAWEYFRIWIVNCALTLVTLGIYSAWAKVRTRRYFETHTFLNGSNFDYHADPKKILKGRLIMGALFLMYSLGGKISPAFAGAAAIIFLGIYPWVIVRSLKFNLANTSYRGLRFGFVGETVESYRVFMKYLVFTIFTLGFGYPKTLEWTKGFQFSNVRYGKSQFRFQIKPGNGFYPIYLKAIAIYFAVAAPVGIALFLALKVFKGTGPDTSDTKLIGSLVALCAISAFYFSAIVSTSVILAGIFNLEADASSIEQLKIRSVSKDFPLAWIMITNVLACIFTAGLMYPWARVRLTRAKLAALRIDAPTGALDQFEAGAVDAAGVNADAAADYLNIDLGF